jgi:plastocyanin
VPGRTRHAAWAAAAGLLLALPGVAEAKTKTVAAGVPPGKVARQIQQAFTDVNDYFPHRTTINVGDRIRFLPVGFHNVDIPARGGDPLPLVSPTGQQVSGSNDAAGQPFWFNGQDQLGFTPALGRMAWGKRVSYNGRARRNSGLPLGENLKPYTVTFKRKGTVRIYCNIHAGMNGVISVKAKGAKVPSKKADARAVKRQLASSLKVAKQLPKTKPPSGVIDVGVAGPDGEEFFGMVPNAVTVPTGTTLRFRMSPRSYDVHTATTGPGNPETDEQGTTYLGQLARSIQQDPVFDPRAAYPSEQPPTTGTLTPLLHGNGFWNTGVMDTATASPLPESNAVTFGAPGKYDFYCLIHPFMKATVTVQ